MPDYEVHWATGGRVVIPADSVEEAHAAAKDLVPPHGDWIDLDVTKIDR